MADLWTHPHLFKVERDDAVEDPLSAVHHEIAEIQTGRTADDEAANAPEPSYS